MSGITRLNTKQTVTVDDEIANCEIIELTDWAGAGVIMPASTNNSTYTLWVAEDRDGTFVALTDTSGVAVEMTVAASKGVPFPDEVFPFGAVKLVSDTDGDTVIVSFKG